MHGITERDSGLIYRDESGGTLLSLFVSEDEMFCADFCTFYALDSFERSME